MRIENGRLILERKDCSCQDGTRPRPVPCKGCGGSGKGKRGGRGGCRKCYGSGREYDSVNPITCPDCNGEFRNAEPENTCDHMPKELWSGLTFKVYRNGPGMTLGETLLGLGCVYSSNDYGREFNNPDDDRLIADVRGQSSCQATKIVDENLNVCDHIGIFVSPSGYTVKPVFAGVPVKSETGAGLFS